MNNVFKILFNDNDLLCVGTLYDSKVTKMTEVSSGEFFSINPISSVDIDYNRNGKPEQLAKRAYMKPRRADINVKTYRNFLFEMDSVPLDDQLIVIGIPQYFL